MEIWKDIKGFEGLYQVSNYGRVKSFKRANEFILKPRSVKSTKRNDREYHSVVLYTKEKKPTKNLIHRLVVREFLPDYDTSLQVNHIDGNSTNNHLSNLEMVTQMDNHIHACIKTRKFSKYAGVTRHKQSGKWQARLTHNGNIIRFSLFDTDYDAAMAYYNYRVKNGLTGKYLMHPNDYPE